MVALGTTGAIILMSLVPTLVGHFLNIPVQYRTEARVTFLILAAGVPIVIGIGGLRGTIAGYGRFKLLNVVRLPFGFLNYLGTALGSGRHRESRCCRRSTRSGWLATLLFAYFASCMHMAPELRRPLWPDSSMVRPLLTFGGWMTVSGVIGPLAEVAERFIIGAAISVSAVAFYATPFMILTNLWILPTSLTGVLFPTFSAGLAEHRERIVQLYRNSMDWISLLFCLSRVHRLRLRRSDS